MEEFLKAWAGNLLAHGGGYILAACLIVMLWLVNRHYEHDRGQLLERLKLVQTQLQEQYEKRVMAAESLRQTLERATDAHDALRATIEEGNVLRVSIVKAFTEMVDDMRGLRRQMDERKVQNADRL